MQEIKFNARGNAVTARDRRISVSVDPVSEPMLFPYTGDNFESNLDTYVRKNNVPANAYAMSKDSVKIIFTPTVAVQFYRIRPKK